AGPGADAPGRTPHACLRRGHGSDGPAGRRAGAGGQAHEGPHQGPRQAAKEAAVSRALDALARQLEGDPYFLASPLARYAASVRLDDAGLAAALACRPEDLTALRLCRAPRPDVAGFRADVTCVAERFGLDADRLAEAVRLGQ